MSPQPWTQNNGQESRVGGTCTRRKPDGSQHERNSMEEKVKYKQNSLALLKINVDAILDPLFLKGWVSEQWPPTMYFHIVEEVRIVPG